MKTVILHNATNAILIQKSDHLETIFSDYKDIVSAIKEKFSPETMVLMEVPPLKNCQKTNILTTNFMNSLKNCSSILHKNLLKKSTYFLSATFQMANYNTLFYNDIHFNFQQGIRFIENAVLSQFLLTSSNLVRLQPLQYSQSAYVSRANTFKTWRKTYS